MAKLNINGKVRDVQVEADTPLLWVIREQVGLTGTKYGCGVAQCGACSVHINGEVQRSCSIPVGSGQGDRQDRHHRGPVGERARIRCRRRGPTVDVPQCGYCQSGQIMAAAALLEEKSEADRRGHRRGDDQHLPLRHLSAHPRGRAPGGRLAQTDRATQGVREGAMKKMTFGKGKQSLAPQVHRRLRGRRRRRSRARLQRAVRAGGSAARGAAGAKSTPGS